MFDRLTTTRLLPVWALAIVGLFLFAVQLLGTATAAAAPLLERTFYRVAVDDASALGLSWLGSYAIANGSVVAALALSLFGADVLTTRQLFLMVAGSRLGAAAVVVFVGVLDYLQKRRRSVRESVGMGVLAFLLTHSVYLPVTAFGYVVLPAFRDLLGGVAGDLSPGVRPFGFLAPFTAAITSVVGPGLSVVLAVAVLFGSLRLFDRLLSGVETATLRQRFFGRLQRTWLSFGFGLLVTGVTTSVAFSLGVVVPLYNRGYVERDELVPYVLGANLGTLFDTLVVAVVLDSTLGVVVVLHVLAVATVVTLVVLLVHDRYSRLVLAFDDRLLADRQAFVAFAAVLVVVPVALVVVPLVLG